MSKMCLEILTGSGVHLDPPPQEYYGGHNRKDPNSKENNCGKYNFFHPTMSPQMGDDVLSQLVSDFLDLRLGHVVFPWTEEGCVSAASAAPYVLTRSTKVSVG